MIRIFFIDFASDKRAATRTWTAVPSPRDRVSLKQSFIGMGTPEDYLGKVSFLEWQDDGTVKIYLIRLDQ